MIQGFRLFSLVLSFFATGICYAQTSAFDSTAVKQLLGDWKGSLTYLDYKSGKPYNMPADLTVRQLSNDKLVFSNIYPNEPNANSNDTVTLADGGKMINNEVVKSKKILQNGNTEIITEYEGSDGNDNKPAIIRHTYTLSKLTYVVRKDVQFKGQADWVKRYEYSYNRK